MNNKINKKIIIVKHQFPILIKKANSFHLNLATKSEFKLDFSNKETLNRTPPYTSRGIKILYFYISFLLSRCGFVSAVSVNKLV